MKRIECFLAPRFLWPLVDLFKPYLSPHQQETGNSCATKGGHMMCYAHSDVNGVDNSSHPHIIAP